MNISAIFFLENRHICDVAHDSAILCLMGIENATFPSNGMALKGVIKLEIDAKITSI